MKGHVSARLLRSSLFCVVSNPRLLKKRRKSRKPVFFFVEITLLISLPSTCIIDACPLRRNAVRIRKALLESDFNELHKLPVLWKLITTVSERCKFSGSYTEFINLGCTEHFCFKSVISVSRELMTTEDKLSSNCTK